jgi:hypothetical protein
MARRTRLVLLPILAAIAVPLHAQLDLPTLESVQLSPALPTSADEVSVLLRSDTGPGCTYFDFPEEASPGPVSISPRPIFIRAAVQVVHVTCPFAKFQHEVRLGKLEPGAYVLQVFADQPPEGQPDGDVLLANLQFEVSGQSERVELHNGSFVAEAEWIGGPAAGEKLQAVTQSKESGYFWSFDSANVELTLKALDGGQVNERIWVFLAPMTSLGVQVTVYDARSGCTPPQCPSKTYTLEPGQPDTQFDVDAFASVP